MKTYSLFQRVWSALCILMLLALSMPVHAATIVPLSSGASQASGRTYKATISYTELAAASSTVSNLTIAIFPGSGTFPAGTMIDNVTVNVVTGFTNSTANNTNLLLYVGDATSTNRWFSGWELDARNPAGTFGVTNIVAAYSATNRLNATFRLTGAAAPTFSTMGQGELEIYFRAYNLNKLEQE